MPIVDLRTTRTRYENSRKRKVLIAVSSQLKLHQKKLNLLMLRRRAYRQAKKLGLLDDDQKQHIRDLTNLIEDLKDKMRSLDKLNTSTQANMLRTATHSPVSKRHT